MRDPAFRHLSASGASPSALPSLLARVLLAALILAVAGAPGSLVAQEASVEASSGQAAAGEDSAGGETTLSPLKLTTVEVEPARPTAETLCRLTVRIENTADQPVSALRFTVHVGGVALPVYRNQLFLENVAPGETTEVKLYNFWASETGRPAPADGKLPVEVSLEEARWLKISTDDDGVENWDLLDAVPGLPASAAVTLPLAAAKP